MTINPDSTKPIYIQIAEWLETEILAQRIKAHEKIYSQYQLADLFNINPATAAKGLKLLLDQEILYKKRGLGMFVTDNAREIILNKRKNETLIALIEELIAEAERLNLGEEELLMMIQNVYRQRKKGGTENGRD